MVQKRHTMRFETMKKRIALYTPYEHYVCMCEPIVHIRNNEILTKY